METEREWKNLNTEKINTQVPSGWYVYNVLVYRDALALNPLKWCSGKDCLEVFLKRTSKTR